MEKGQPFIYKTMLQCIQFLPESLKWLLIIQSFSMTPCLMPTDTLFGVTVSRLCDAMYNYTTILA